MTTMNISDDTFFGYREEAIRRGMLYKDGKPNIPGLINNVLVEQLAILQQEKLK
jgi:hypothetical protein